MGEEPVRWSINVDRQTDIDLRTHLAQRGMKKGDLSKFVEQAVKWRLIRQTMTDVQKRFSHMSSEEIDALVAEAVAWARSPEGIASDSEDPSRLRP
jgi:Ribbon-helix-helix domain